MAISMENPQDPGNPQLPQYISVEQKPEEKHDSYYPMKRKPSRTLLYFRNRANTSNVSMSMLIVVLSVLLFHRIFSLYMSHRRWINAPITYIERPCRSPHYDTMQDSDAGKICITTLTDSKSTSAFQRFMRWRNFDGILELTWQNKMDYARKHGYQMFDGSELIDTSRPPAWSKILAVAHLMNQDDCDWVMWADADTVFMNSDQKIENFLPADPTKHLLVGSDNGGGYNSGVFLLRKSEWSRQFLSDWWDMRSFVRPPGMALSGDNNAMKALLRDMPDFQEHVLSPARCTFNSFAKFLTFSEQMTVMTNLNEQPWYNSEEYYHKGDFLAHTPGGGLVCHSRSNIFPSVSFIPASRARCPRFLFITTFPNLLDQRNGG
eukprot:CAMPEP_0168722934 /NCGR_PEP_ID=MMETSP0724-20121128/2854_1 /TAXON_ID=265536 /ORGANISM="Amphiprora sp., Strain CCMP467" /LENGTH=376 /DNA_ID=CAMNT_0008769623 /DNA_START=119 /DNA_END=1245 /DNA_ORIENTATION=+